MTFTQAGILILIIGIIAAAIGALPSRIVHAETEAIRRLRVEHDQRVSELLAANGREVERRRALTSAAWRLYHAGHWTCDRPGWDETGLWTDLRDAAGIVPGTATALGMGAPQ